MPGIWVDLCRAVAPFLPVINAPDKPCKTREKSLYVFGVLLFYLVASKTPLYGIRPSSTEDPMGFYRVLLAANRGTLMELGIGPLVTSGMVLQALTGMKLISVDRSNPEEQRMHDVLEKIAGMFVIFAQAAFTTVFSGMYGSMGDLGIGNAALIIVQLCISAFFVLMLDDMLKIGYGFGSAISLFISVNICENIMWQGFSFRVVSTIVGAEYEGAIVNLAMSLINESNKLRALKHAFFRTSLPNVSNLLSTLVVFCVVIYFQGFRVDIPIKHTKMRKGGTNQTYPIRLFYTSNVPIMLQSTLTSTMFMLSSTLHNRLGTNALTRLLGQWMTFNGRSVPVGGIIYYLSPPQGVAEIFRDPIHFVVYVLYVLISCSVLGVLWLEMSGSSPKDVVKTLRQQSMTVVGYRQDTMITAFNRYIPTAAGFGGFMVGALTIFADLLGALGSGTGILLAVGNILQYVEQIQKEMEQEVAQGRADAIPGFSNLFS